MISADTLKKVDAYWAGYFGCSEADLNGKDTKVFTHAALGTFDGALVFRRKDACIVSVPATLVQSRLPVVVMAPAEAAENVAALRVASTAVFDVPAEPGSPTCSLT